MTEININDYVEVVLTERGAFLYNQYQKQFENLYPGQVTRYKVEGDVLRDSLWHIMQVFGPHIHLGCKVPFLDCKIIVGKGKI